MYRGGRGGEGRGGRMMDGGRGRGRGRGGRWMDHGDGGGRGEGGRGSGIIGMRGGRARGRGRMGGRGRGLGMRGGGGREYRSPPPLREDGNYRGERDRERDRDRDYIPPSRDRGEDEYSEVSSQNSGGNGDHRGPGGGGGGDGFWGGRGGVRDDRRRPLPGNRIRSNFEPHFRGGGGRAGGRGGGRGPYQRPLSGPFHNRDRERDREDFKERNPALHRRGYSPPSTRADTSFQPAHKRPRHNDMDGNSRDAPLSGSSRTGPSWTTSGTRSSHAASSSNHRPYISMGSRFSQPRASNREDGNEHSSSSMNQRKVSEPISASANKSQPSSSFLSMAAPSNILSGNPLNTSANKDDGADDALQQYLQKRSMLTNENKQVNASATNREQPSESAPAENEDKKKLNTKNKFETARRSRSPSPPASKPAPSDVAWSRMLDLCAQMEFAYVKMCVASRKVESVQNKLKLLKRQPSGEKAFIKDLKALEEVSGIYDD